MKKFLFFLCLFVLLPLPCMANEPTAFNVDEGLSGIGAEQLLEQLPESAKELLEQAELDNPSISDMIAMSPAQFWIMLKSAVATQVKKPMILFFSLLAIILICALLEGASTSFLSSSTKTVFSVVSVLCAISFIANPIINCITRTAQTIQDCSTFLLAFVPTFSGLLVAGGHAVTAGSYNFFLFGACQLMSQISATVLVPLTSIYFALCLVSSAAPDLNLGGVTSSIKTIVCWALGLLTTLFVGLFSIQTMVSSGADGLSIKASKFLIGSFIPVIGGALSDAFSVARSCLLLMKTTFGAFGIIGVLLIFLPILIEVTIWTVTLNFTTEIAKLMEQAELAKVLKSAGTTLSIMLAFVMCFALLVIVSTTVVMVTAL